MVVVVMIMVAAKLLNKGLYHLGDLEPVYNIVDVEFGDSILVWIQLDVGVDYLLQNQLFHRFPADPSVIANLHANAHHAIESKDLLEVRLAYWRVGAAVLQVVSDLLLNVVPVELLSEEHNERVHLGLVRYNQIDEAIGGKADGDHVPAQHIRVQVHVTRLLVDVSLQEPEPRGETAENETIDLAAIDAADRLQAVLQTEGPPVDRFERHRFKRKRRLLLDEDMDLLAFEQPRNFCIVLLGRKEEALLLIGAALQVMRFQRIDGVA